MQELARDRFTEVKVMFFRELFHSAYRLPPGIVALILGVRKHCNGHVDELIHGTKNTALDGFLNYTLLFRGELNNHADASQWRQPTRPVDYGQTI
jgi:hypothetical protein